MTEPIQQLLKTDVLGRVRASRQRREAMLEEFERSGASARRFAKLSGVKYQTFCGWVQRRRQRGTSGLPSAAPRLLEAVLEGGRLGSSSQTLRVELPGGACMELTDPSQAALAAALLRELAQTSRSQAPC